MGMRAVLKCRGGVGVVVDFPDELGEVGGEYVICVVDAEVQVMAVSQLPVVVYSQRIVVDAVVNFGCRL